MWYATMQLLIILTSIELCPKIRGNAHHTVKRLLGVTSPKQDHLQVHQKPSQNEANPQQIWTFLLTLAG